MENFDSTRKYGRLQPIDKTYIEAKTSGKRETAWICKCDCGNVAIVRQTSLKKGNTKSCGCYRNECSSKRMHAKTKHGLGGTRLARVWGNMHDRCENPHNKSYYLYGGKGVQVCKEWQDLRKFYDWAMSHGYKEGLTLDRISSQGNYEPSNCRWVDRIIQNNNTSRNHLLTYRGETKSMAQWCRELGLSYAAVKIRINRRHWSTERALSTPVQK